MNTAGSDQRGASTLGLVAVVLFVALMVAGYSSLVLGLEHQSLQGLQRATQSRQLAQAGLDWGIALLNAPTPRNSQCKPDPTATHSFRQRYARPASPVPEVMCELSTALNCRCSELSGPAIPAPAGPGFAVRLAPQLLPDRIRLTANACHSPQQACVVQNTDALTVTLAAEPVLKHPPQAALTCGASCSVSGAVANTFPSSGGATVIAGGTVKVEAGARLDSPPGTPTEAGLVTANRDLSIRHGADRDCTQGLVFQSFFGLPPAAYALAPHVKRIECTAATDCTDRLQKAYTEGWRLFDFPNGLHLKADTGGSLWGTPQSPLVVVTQGPVQWNGSHTLHGLLFINHPDAQVDPGSPLVIEGGLMACGSLGLGANARVNHRPDLIAEAVNVSKRYVVIPGSWSDRP